MLKLLSICLLVSSCDVINSNSFDEDRYGDNTPTGSTEFLASYQILMDRCANCHSSAVHSAWASYLEEEDWINAGLISPGDYNSSDLIQRMINYGSGPEQNMPQGGSAIPEEEYDQLIDWIDNI